MTILVLLGLVAVLVAANKMFGEKEQSIETGELQNEAVKSKVEGGSVKTQLIPTVFASHKVEIMMLNECLDWFVKKLEEDSDPKTWKSSRVDTYGEFSFFVETDSRKYEMSAKKSRRGWYIELGSNDPEAQDIGHDGGFLYYKINESIRFFAENLPNECFEKLFSDRFKKICKWVEDGDRQSRSHKEQEYLSKLPEEERQKRIDQKANSIRYWELREKSHKGQLSDDEATEFVEIKKKQAKEKRKQDEQKQIEVAREMETFKRERAKKELLSEARERERRAKLDSVAVSDSRHEYIISNEDYKRGHERERNYLLKHKPSLLRFYDNRCANCGDDSNGLDIDHFIFSKNEGGCFEMFHKDGHSVNNAIPLCESCNRSKSDKSYKDFFNAEKILELMEKNVFMTKRLNDEKFARGKKG